MSAMGQFDWLVEQDIISKEGDTMNENDRRLATEAFPRLAGSRRFHAILKELGELHDKKQADYGKNDDPFANVRASQEWGIKPWVGALLRLNDKVKRLQSLASNGGLRNESAEDSMRDIAVYAIIALVLFEEEKF